MNDEKPKTKKLVIRKRTIQDLQVQTGIKTGMMGTCSNHCGTTTDTCPDAATQCA